ncbi:hypothetical protein BD560DRAFT_494362 [Blakeslea trispora]|nr:hypothetical protein BD560DRAFT_494362 [Blakeslea trispora]
MQGHEQHQMRCDPLHMHFVMSMLCPLVVIGYLMSSANSESNKIQRDEATSSGMERTSWIMISDNDGTGRRNEHTRKKTDMNRSDIGWEYNKQLNIWLRRGFMSMTTNREI